MTLDQLHELIRDIATFTKSLPENGSYRKQCDKLGVFERLTSEHGANRVVCVREFSDRYRRENERPFATGVHSKYFVLVGQRFTTSERDARKPTPIKKNVQ